MRTITPENVYSNCAALKYVHNKLPSVRLWKFEAAQLSHVELNSLLSWIATLPSVALSGTLARGDEECGKSEGMAGRSSLKSSSLCPHCCAHCMKKRSLSGRMQQGTGLWCSPVSRHLSITMNLVLVEQVRAAGSRPHYVLSFLLPKYSGPLFGSALCLRLS